MPNMMPLNIVRQRQFDSTNRVSPAQLGRPVNNNMPAVKPITNFQSNLKIRPASTLTVAVAAQKAYIERAPEQEERIEPATVFITAAVQASTINEVSANVNSGLSLAEKTRLAMQNTGAVEITNNIVNFPQAAKEISVSSVSREVYEAKLIKVLSGENFISDLIKMLAEPNLVAFLANFVNIDRDLVGHSFSEVQRLSGEVSNEKEVVATTTGPQEISIKALTNALNLLKNAQDAGDEGLSSAAKLIQDSINRAKADISMHSENLIKKTHELGLAQAILSTLQEKIKSLLPGHGEGLSHLVQIYRSLNKIESGTTKSSEGVSLNVKTQIQTLTTKKEKNIESLIAITRSLVDIILNLSKLIQSERTNL